MSIYPIDLLEKYLYIPTEVPVQLKPFLAKVTGPSKPPSKSSWRHETRYLKSQLLMKNKDGDENIVKEKVTEILNRISDKNFDENCDELMNIEVKSKKNLDDYVEVVFIKAIREHSFSKLYARLCRRLVGCYIEEDDKKIYFRDLLINRCQNMFERSTSVKNDFIDQEDLFKAKENVLGCMNFIGELYNRDLLTDKIIYTCFYMLNNKLPHKYMYTVDSLCSLFLITGDKFLNKCPDLANKALGFLKNARTIEGIANKDKFAIMDVLDKYGAET